MLPAGTVLFTSRAPIGYIAIARNPVCTNQGFKSFVLKDDVVPDYVYWWLKGNKELTESLASGTTFLELSGAKAKLIPIPIAPLDEQKGIVAEVEKQFSRLDEAVTGLKRAKANLKRYKAAVLKAAVEGKLTEHWRKEHPDVEPASKLLEWILTERRRKWEEAELAKMKAQGKEPKDDNWKRRYKEPIKPKELVEDSLPETWKLVVVDQLSFVVRGASPRPAGDPKYFGGNIPWITVGELTKDDDVYLDEVPLFVTEEGKKASRFIERGTFLLTNSGATLGVPKITRIAGCINDGSVALLFLNDTLKKYLYYFFASITNRLRQINQGAAQPNLNTTIIRNLVVPLPPDGEQKAIIAEIENRLSSVTSTMRIVDTNLRRSEIFRQSILKQAFSGRLAPQCVP
jgi:type I restriction enzyme S subunit